MTCQEIPTPSQPCLSIYKDTNPPITPETTPEKSQRDTYNRMKKKKKKSVLVNGK